MPIETIQSPHEPSADPINQIFKTFEIPTCPSIVIEVMAETRKEAPDLEKVAKSIANDIGMSAITLRMANSPLFRTNAPITSIRSAMERLGMRNIVCVVVAGALRNSMTDMPGHFIEKFWDRTSVVATASSLIARRQRGGCPDVAYTYALFHDIGVPLMLRRYPDYEKMHAECCQSGKMLIDVEADCFPCNHPIIGSMMVRSWGLPADIGHAIRFHHEADAYDLPEEVLAHDAVSLIAQTHIAERIASEIFAEDDVEVGEELYHRALTHFGIASEELEQLHEDINLAINESKH